MGTRTERGASSLLVVSLVGVLVTVTVALLGVAVLFHSHRVAATAADLAALAAARSHVYGSDACGVAAGVAADNGADLTACSVEGDHVRVVVGVPAPGWVGDLTGAVLVGEAVAGPSSAGGASW